MFAVNGNSFDVDCFVLHVQAASTLPIVFGEKVNRTKV